MFPYSPVVLGFHVDLQGSSGHSGLRLLVYIYICIYVYVYIDFATHSHRPHINATTAWSKLNNHLIDMSYGVRQWSTGETEHCYHQTDVDYSLLSIFVLNLSSSVVASCSTGARCSILIPFPEMKLRFNVDKQMLFPIGP